MYFRRRVRTLYDCAAGHQSELSFVPGQIITNGEKNSNTLIFNRLSCFTNHHFPVYQSKEPGWLVGTLNGRSGLIPGNYVEPLP